MRFVPVSPRVRHISCRRSCSPWAGASGLFCSSHPAVRR